MPADFELDIDNRIVHSRAWGKLTDEDLLTHMARLRELVDAGRVDATWAQVWDLSATESFEAVSTSGVQRLAERNPWPRGAIRVVIATRDLPFGLVRMYQALGDAGANVEIVRSTAEAVTVIEEQRSVRPR